MFTYSSVNTIIEYPLKLSFTGMFIKDGVLYGNCDEFLVGDIFSSDYRFIRKFYIQHLNVYKPKLQKALFLSNDIGNYVDDSLVFNISSIIEYLSQKYSKIIICFGDSNELTDISIGSEEFKMFMDILNSTNKDCDVKVRTFVSNIKVPFINMSENIEFYFLLKLHDNVDGMKLLNIQNVKLSFGVDYRSVPRDSYIIVIKNIHDINEYLRQYENIDHNSIVVYLCDDIISSTSIGIIMLMLFFVINVACREYVIIDEN